MIQKIGKHYVYKHIRKDKNEIFYIGIGTKNTKRKCIKIPSIYGRAYSLKDRNKIWHSIVNKTEYTVEILLESDNYEFIKQKEIEFIKLYGRINLKTGTFSNLTDGGDGSVGKVYSEKEREIYRIAKLKSIEKLGYVHTPEALEKMRQAIVGRPCSVHAKDKIKSKAKERGFKGIEKAINSRKRAVEQFDLEGNFINSFPSLMEAQNETGISLKLIQAVCKNRRKKTHNFKFKYKE